MTHALILVDIQKDYFVGGRMPLIGSDQAAERASELLSYFRKNALPVVHIQHVAIRPGATFFLPNTEGVEIHPCVAPLAGEKIIQKHYPNSFRDTPLLDVLRAKGVDHLVIAGMMTHMCVDATVRAAFDFGFRCTVVQDGCATRNLMFEGAEIPARQVHGAFLAALSGTYAKIVSSNDLISGQVTL
jgi:nicotinamidase-related amidase